MLLKQEEVSFYLGDWEGTKGVTKVERTQTADATEGWTVQPVPLHPILGFPKFSWATFVYRSLTEWGGNTSVTFTHMLYLSSEWTSWSPGLLTSSQVTLVRVSWTPEPWALIEWAGMSAGRSEGTELVSLEVPSCLQEPARQDCSLLFELLHQGFEGELYVFPWLTLPDCVTQPVIWVSRQSSYANSL